MYPELVALIGGNVPNYQGVFLRGYGGQTSYHYGAVGHWSAGLGELQGDAIRNITGTHSSRGPRLHGGQQGPFTMREVPGESISEVVISIPESRYEDLMPPA